MLLEALFAKPSAILMLDCVLIMLCYPIVHVTVRRKVILCGDNIWKNDIDDFFFVFSTFVYKKAPGRTCI